MWAITSGANFDHLVTVVSSRFPYCKVTICPFVIKKCVVEEIL